MAIPSTRQTARFYDALSRGEVTRGIWGKESRFDPAKIIDSESVDRHFRRVVRRFVGPTVRVLDVGCGPGGFTAVLAETAREAVGLDVSEGWVDTATSTFAARGLRHARAVLGTGSAMPFGDGDFDVVTLIDVLHHLDEPGATLREARRVLRRGGRLLVFEPNKLNPLLTFLCLFDTNEWGFLRGSMGTIAAYRKLLAPYFAVDEAHYSGLLIGPDGRNARRLADALVESRMERLVGWLSPKIFVAATRA